MTHTYVFVDVETTGFDPKRDAIIEVAAVKWQDGQVLDSYASLVNPDREVPFEITQLTGIFDVMVKTAPRMGTVRSRLRRVIGDSIVVGHNVDFDLGFLHEELLALGNHRIDTVTLASILYPTIGRYSLGNLIKALNLPETEYHRAEADAYHTLNLFVNLFERALNDVDFVLLEEITEAGQKLGWPETVFFREALNTRVQRAFTNPEAQGRRMQRLFKPPKLEGNTLVPPDEEEVELKQIDPTVVTGMLQAGSNFSRRFPNFEPRQQQINMAAAVMDSLNRGEHLIVEAGTGTGKSLAYLLPSAFWSTENERRVVISTNTINLQDQLINKDIPLLQEILPFELRVAVRKGKSNYLCARLFQQMRHRGPRDKDEMALYARLLLWLGRSETGDVGEISLRTAGERMAWRRLSGENAPCSTTECAAEKCPLHFARRRAEIAHIVIVNHALLLADVANQNHILPFFSDLIIDEAHHLEQAVTNGLSFSADKKYLETLIDEIKQPKGTAIGELRGALKGVPDWGVSKFDEIIDKLRSDAFQANNRLDEFFEALSYFVRQYVSRKSDFSQAVRLVGQIRQSAEFQQVKLDWENLNNMLATIIKGLVKLGKALTQAYEQDWEIENREELQAEIAKRATDIDEVRENVEVIINQATAEDITWIDVWRDRLSLHNAPLHIGHLVEEHLLEKLDSLVLTSATMRTAPQGRYDRANFDYIRSRLNAFEVKEMAVGSPFDYKSNTLVYLCTDIPEPRQPAYQRYVEQAIIDTATALGGRTLVLFTSYKQLRETANAIQGALAEQEIQLLAQLQGSSRQNLTAQFKNPDARAVLLGTRSFWEGVDVPGPALEAVMVVKLPFDVPSDPIIGARSETFDNPFMDYAIPEAVLRFRQGFGRLIRRKTDEGIVIVLDKRVLTKRYGELFLNALPDCTMLRQRTNRLPEIIRRWQNRQRD